MVDELGPDVEGVALADPWEVGGVVVETNDEEVDEGVEDIEVEDDIDEELEDRGALMLNPVDQPSHSVFSGSRLVLFIYCSHAN